MYDLTIGLSYNESLELDYRFRYDFVCFDLEPKWGNGPLNGSIFVFRTIIEGNAAGNVLIDLIDHSNVNAFDISLHGNAHIHTLKIDSLIEQNKFSITDNITIQATENTLNNVEFQAIIKEQKYKFKREKEYFDFNEIKYHLFTKYHADIANMQNYYLAPIFKLQKEHIWHQNRYINFNDLSQLDIDKYVNNKLDPNPPWNKVKEIIKNNKEIWRKEDSEKYKELLNAKEIHWYVNT